MLVFLLPLVWGWRTAMLLGFFCSAWQAGYCWGLSEGYRTPCKGHLTCFANCDSSLRMGMRDPSNRITKPAARLPTVAGNHSMGFANVSRQVLRTRSPRTHWGLMRDGNSLWRILVSSPGVLEGIQPWFGVSFGCFCNLGESLLWCPCKKSRTI